MSPRVLEQLKPQEGMKTAPQMSAVYSSHGAPEKPQMSPFHTGYYPQDLMKTVGFRVFFGTKMAMLRCWGNYRFIFGEKNRLGNGPCSVSNLLFKGIIEAPECKVDPVSSTVAAICDV